ncbi:MAG: hypothetical protein ACJASX_002201 [Limisphaerales bacterium]|jgi:hypothetical protein
MITTKRYDYVHIDRISEHPDVRNHRPVEKVAEFLDRSVSWLEEINRYAPGRPREVRDLFAAAD